MPNSDNVSGITAATGMLRPTTIKGAKKALTRRKQPHSTPKGIPTSGRQPKPQHHALQADQRVAGQGVIEPEAAEVGERLGGAGQDRRAQTAAPREFRRGSAPTTRRRRRRGNSAQQKRLPDGDLAAQGRQPSRPAVGAAGGTPRPRRSMAAVPAGHDRRGVTIVRPAAVAGLLRLHVLALRSVSSDRAMPLYCFSAGIDLDLHAAVLRLVEGILRDPPAGPSPGRRPRTGSARA